MARGIYLRANGEINCYCSTGEQISLAKLPNKEKNWNFIDDYYFKGLFKEIRSAMKIETLPFPTQCFKCNYLDPFCNYDEKLLKKEIEWAHIESAAVCNLKCPFCVHGIPSNERKYSRSGPKYLSFELYRKIINDIKNANMNIKWMYFSGRGEPALHKSIWEMVSYAKKNLNTNFLVNTNGNIKYTDDIVDSGLDKIKIAIDSIDQKIYGRYRINGYVSKILDFTEKIAQKKNQNNNKFPLIIWQKVMFNYNDSDEELIEYQKKAKQCGVDQIRLVFTWTSDFSTRNPEEIPIIFDNVEITNTFERDNLSLDELNKRVDLLDSGPNIPDCTMLLSKILHWFELGIENRDRYDNFANLQIYDKKLINYRQKDPNLSKYTKVMELCLKTLSQLYHDNGIKNVSIRYNKWAEKLVRNFHDIN